MKTPSLQKTNTLLRCRLAARLSLREVAHHYRGGVTRERIRQIESSLVIRPETADAYRAAVSAAVQERDRLNAIYKRVATEFAAKSLNP